MSLGKDSLDSVSVVYISVAKVLFNVVLFGLFLLVLIFVQITAQFGLQKSPSIFIVIVVVVETRLEQLVHFVLIGALVLKATTIVVISTKDVNLIVAIVFIIIKHTQEATFLLLFKFFAATERPCS